MNSPGYASAQGCRPCGWVRGFRAGRISPRRPRDRSAADDGGRGDRCRPLLCRHTDDVFGQLRAFYDLSAAGHLLMMGQGGLLSHEDTVANLTLFSEEVLPRIGDLGA